MWLNLLLLILGVAGLLYGRYHREKVSREFASVLSQEQRTPADTAKIKEELAAMDLSRQELSKELDGRMQFVKSLKSEDFYLSIDTKVRKLRFFYGDTVLREADVTLGESQSFKSDDGKSWTFVSVKGAFPIEGKAVDPNWKVPEWVYLMKKEPVPDSLPVVAGGLGKYVLFLPNGYVIHTPPVEASPLDGAKPGSFMVPEADLAAIWARIQTSKTQVYVF